MWQEMTISEEFCVYTDGGCSGNPGPGGWAYVIIQADSLENRAESVSVAENWGGEKATTNNRMELMAVIEALKYLSRTKAAAKEVTVYTDSQYVQKGMSIWLKDWKSKGWKTSSKNPVKNQDLWQCLDSLAAGFSIKWIWVKGHAGDQFNERCDALTQKAIASL